ncbi:hypothetical protein WDW37_16575 [Bdellovibrionota bacterium FG-1]
MKKFLALFGLFLVAMNPSVRADSGFLTGSFDDVLFSALTTQVVTLDLINWKVGDSQQFDVKAGSFGKLGTMVKSVTQDDGATIWITQNMDLMIQKQKVEMQMNKADGKILKMIVNGKEQQIPDDKVEIISQDYADVTVPAGTFKAIHIVAKTAQAPHIEIWANPRDTVMEGTLKQAITTQGMDIVMELTTFKRMP